MGQISNNLESILSNEFLSDEDILNELEKDLHEFCVLILETFRNEEKNKH